MFDRLDVVSHLLEAARTEVHVFFQLFRELGLNLALVGGAASSFFEGLLQQLFLVC